ncbi:uncharacterized protein LOC131666270 [Phymastichus coffea]|uniref:uncharacterized protein LOC131666270 n=1 Tax=Phymastichus coffea TaxID=108790 RepID=UPI00273CD2B1|nr:uncharacterized protein LOC131666270 [Phymastichus coffea]
MDSSMSTAAYVHHRAGSSGGSCGSSTAMPQQQQQQQPPPHPVNGNGGGGGGGSRMAVIGVTRNVKLRRRGAAGFGFSLRGGREYAAGFYVSDVVPGGEAHSHGLRVGDQILRVNGYPVEDAVHQEVALLAKNQQVLVLKIRSVGMIPVKDNPNDPVTWHMVQQQQQQLQFGDAVTNEIRIRVVLGEKGRLGCGVCRGLVPGLTVQGTREGGPARAAGLKAGDVITWCNGQSLTDLPFERAIESMRSAQVLDLLVNRPIVPSPNAQSTANHVYDCPEALWMRGSSGYDSENSSLVGSPQHRPTNACNRNLRNCCPPSINAAGPSDWGHVEQSQEWMRKVNNTTVIRIGQQQQQQQQQYQARRGPPPPLRRNGYDDDEPIYDPVAPRDYECHDFDANPRDELDRRAEYRREHGIREVVFEDVFVKENGQTTDGGSVVLNGSKPTQQQLQQQQQQTQQQPERKTVTSVEVHQPSPPAPPSMPYKWPTESKPMNAMGMQMGSTISMGSTGSTETESSLESSCGGKDNASTSSASSSCEPPLVIQQPSSFATSIAAACAQGAGVKVQERGKAVKVPPPPPPPPIDLGSAITQELQRRKQRNINNGGGVQESEKTETIRKQPQNPEALRAQEQKVTHDKLMEEFKRAHQRMFSNAQQRNQSNEQNSSEQHRKDKSSAPPTIPKKPASLVTANNKNNNNNNKKIDEAVEMQSIESFKLKEPTTSTQVPKPPKTYFPSPSKPHSTLKKVAVRIGTYSDVESRQPSKLGFLKTNNNGVGRPASRLHSELAATLLRSNLRGESENANSTEEANNKTNSQENNVEKLANSLNNKVTIRVNPEANGTTR